jgi:hypothetical protein
MLTNITNIISKELEFRAAVRYKRLYPPNSRQGITP